MTSDLSLKTKEIPELLWFGRKVTEVKTFKFPAHLLLLTH